MVEQLSLLRRMSSRYVACTACVSASNGARTHKVAGVSGMFDLDAFGRKFQREPF